MYLIPGEIVAQPYTLDTCVMGIGIPSKSGYVKYKNEFKCDLINISTEDRNKLPIITVKVNFHYCQSLDPNAPQFYFGGSNDYSYYNVETFSQLMLSEMNTIFSNLVDNPIESQDIIGDSRIRFVLYTDPNNSSDIHDGIWIHSSRPSDLSALPYGDSVLNIILDGNLLGHGAYVQGTNFYYNYMIMKHDAWTVPTVGWWYKGRLAGHEFLHLASLCDAFAPGQCDGIDIDAANECNDNGNKGYCGEPGTCDAWNSGSKNIMGYNAWQSALSPCQWSTAYEYIHMYQPNFIQICSDSADLIISSGNHAVWNDTKLLNRNVIIQPQAILTINCEVRMGADKMIYVERGGKLEVDNGIITNMCKNLQWKGIIVEGNANRTQPSIYDSLTTLDAGVVHSYNQSIIEFANNAISTDAIRRTWPTIQDYYGGKIVVDNTEFRNNNRGIEFMKYPLTETSTVSNCKFYEDPSQMAANNSVGITIWACNGLTVTNTQFHDLDLQGIYGIDFSAKVHSGCTFDNISDCGFKADETAPYQSYAQIGKVGTVPNTFSHITNAGIYTTALTGSEGLLISNNVFSNGIDGVNTSNLSFYEIYSNSFDHLISGIKLKNTLTNNNYVSCNSFFDDMTAGLSVIGNNGANGAGMSFLYNNFYNPTNDVNITNDISAGSLGSVKQSIGSSLNPANNCFSKLQVNIVANPLKTINFSYYFQYDPNVTCYNPHGSLTDGGTNNYYEYSSNFAPTIICGYTQPGVVDIEARESAMLQPANEKLRFINKHLSTDDIGTVRDILTQSDEMTDHWLYFGILFKLQKYDEAYQFLTNRKHISEDDKAFTAIELVNLKFAHSGIEAIHTQDSLLLEKVAATARYLSRPYARGLLHLLYGRTFAYEVQIPDVYYGDFLVNNDTNDKKFQLAPNPAHAIVRIYGDTKQLLGYNIYDMQGGRISISAESVLGGYIEIPVSALTSGAYMIRLRLKTGYELHTFIKL